MTLAYMNLKTWSKFAGFRDLGNGAPSGSQNFTEPPLSFLNLRVYSCVCVYAWARARV